MKFEKIYIELSDICGLKCPFCPSKKGERGFMSVKHFKIITAKIQNKARIYTFHLLGDPLIVPNLEEFIDIANFYKMPLELTTSGFYMSEKNQSLLLESKNLRQLNISLIAFFGQDKKNKEQYLKPILKLCKRHIEAEKKFFINLRLWNLNTASASQNDEFYTLLEQEFKLKINKFAPKNKLASRIILHQNEGFEWAGYAKKQSEVGSCYALKGQIGVLSSGFVVPCCMDAGGRIVLGNLLEQSLDEILHSQRALKMKEGFKQGILHENLCKTCSFAKAKTQRA